MLSSALNFLLSTVFNLMCFMFMLRFLMQYLRCSFANPVGQIVIALTDFAVKPTRKLIPAWRKLDITTLLLALASQLLLQWLLLLLRGYPFSLAGGTVWTVILGSGLLGVVRTVLDIFFYAILLQAILSWVNPYHPVNNALNPLTQPIIKPIRRIVPTANGIDLSPLVALILLQMLNVSVVSVLTYQLSIML
ncbi:MAG TPA: YggT family protein [Methylophilus sp.]|nr:YggT family protein [Methylophilus sp.]HQQ33084.1 YggT family protein [Methylophilus sp.]